MRGQPYSFSGKNNMVEPTTFFPPPPVQRPRVPVWVVGAHPSERSMGACGALGRSAAQSLAAEGIRAGEGRERLALVVAGARVAREAAGLPWEGYDVVAEGTSTADGGGARAVAEWADAGATWWVESDWDGGSTPSIA